VPRNLHESARAGFFDEIQSLPLSHGEIKTADNFVELVSQRSFHDKKVAKYFSENHLCTY
jgi:hypothetical protein